MIGSRCLCRDTGTCGSAVMIAVSPGESYPMRSRGCQLLRGRLAVMKSGASTVVERIVMR